MAAEREVGSAAEGEGGPAAARPDEAVPAPRRAAEGQNDEVIGVFLLDDHEIVRRGVRDLINEEPDLEVVGEAGTADAALEVIERVRPDVAVLDVRLQDGSGIEVCRDIRSAHPRVACLMLTSYADDDALLGSVLAGAAGFVLKQVRGGELLTGIRQVATGGSLIEPDVAARAVARMRARTQEDRQLASLTPQERRILDLLAEGMTNREIADALYLAEKTVKNYVSNLLMKLGMKHRTEAAVYAARLADRQS